MRSLPHDRTEAARRTCRCLPCGNRDEPVTRDNHHALVFRHRHNFRDAENFRLTSMPSDKWVRGPPGDTLQPEAIGAVMEVTKWLKPSISGHDLVTVRVCRPQRE
jgi:hypothetical protein